MSNQHKTPPAEREADDDTTTDPELETGEVESSGQRAGMGRGEKPRKLKSEAK